MYVEDLDPFVAQQILGDEYNNMFHYRLYSSPDKFVIGIIDSTGKLIDEKELQQDYEPLPEEDDEIFQPHYTNKKSHDVIKSWLLTGSLIVLLMGFVALSFVFLKMGGVL